MDGRGHAVYIAKWCATILGRYVCHGIQLTTIGNFVLWFYTKLYLFAIQKHSREFLMRC